MKVEYYREYSSYMGRDMEFKVYGHSGRPVLAFPSQDGRFFDFENNGMVEAASRHIEEGRIQLFCCDSNDIPSWSSTDPDYHKRILEHERFYNYICEELCPRIAQINGNHGIITTGCSMGGTHALNFLLRRPDLFAGCIALSGVYDAHYFFPNYNDELIYMNSPIDYLDGMAYDHPYVELYRYRTIICCVGQGAWENPTLQDAHRLQELFAYKDIPARIDFWGTDVCHDWPWWRKQLPYFLDAVC